MLLKTSQTNGTCAHRRSPPWRRPITALAALVAIFAFGASAAQAATRQVSPAGANSGACISSPCLTIQYAVEQAVADDTIEVGAGAYAAGATINKPLTLLGAQAGLDARTRNVPDAQESVVSPAANAFTLPSALVGTVTIDGFKIAPTGANVSGVLMQGGSGNVVSNDIFSGIAEGAAAKGIFNGATFEHDRVEGTKIGFEANSQPATNLKIDANDFLGESYWSINIIQGGTGIEIADNHRTGAGGNFLQLQRTSGAAVSGNSADGIGSIGLFIGGGNSNTTVTGNQFTNLGSEPGIIFSNLGPGVNAGAVISGNTLVNDRIGLMVNGSSVISGAVEVHANRIVGNSDSGVSNDAGSGASIDATDNWWGCNAGPTVDGSTGCDTIAGAVDADPWLVLSAVTTPASVMTGQNATAGAAIDTDSDGLAAGPVPDGTPITFATDDGSLSPTSGTFTAGRAQATLTAGAAPGSATMTATVDGQPATVAVQVTQSPTNSAAPTVSGDAPPGSRLTCSDGSWSGYPAPTLTYRWLRGGTEITGATDPTYVTVADDVGQAVSCSVTATSAVGSASAASSNSVAVTAPAPAAPTPTATPSPVTAPAVKPAAKEGPTTVPNNGKVTIASISCPSGSCTVSAAVPRATIGGKSYKIQVKLPKQVGSGNPAPVRVVLTKKAREALLRQGQGRVKIRLSVTASDGTRRTFVVNVVLKPKS